MKFSFRKPKLNFKAYLAELIGTFMLALVAFLGVTNGGIPPFLAVPFTLMLFVYTVGSVSGAHLNPAVTVALATLKKLSPQDAFFYIVAQMAGAGLAMVSGKGLLGRSPELTVESSFQIGIVEAVGAFLLLFGVSAVVHKRVSLGASGVAVGGSLFLGINIAGQFSNGILNPALAVALGSVSVAYIAGPILGAITAVWIYQFMVSK
ncbi:MAG: major intrinsic protein [uncultured bacterium]|nr:MAG: major intrinsic protein [uncultured bacterium]KKT72739.1 MAG: Major intrinsic protein [Candidatus Peregrinibacteria bacterium GW2011_GWA2_44_7]